MVQPLGYRPQLDGLRAVAITIVVLYHAEVPGFVGGGIGVDLFFVLSGFLITVLLLEERGRTGTVDLGAFWVRRARRLLPALFVFLAAMTVLAVGLGIADLWFFTGVLGALTYTLNLLRSHFEAGFGLIGHLWSLSVEEQFYLVWPVAFVLLRRRNVRTVLAVALTVAVAAAVWRAWLYPSAGWFPLYSRPDTRADALAIGCAAAAAWKLYDLRRVARWWPAAAIVFALPATTIHASDGFYYLGGFTVVALAAAVLVVAAVEGVLPGLDRTPAVWIGRRAYAIYLWQTPLILLVQWSGGGWVTASLAGGGLSVAIAALSWRVVEEPWLRRPRRSYLPEQR